MTKIVPYFVEALFVSDVLSFSLEISTIDDGINGLQEGFQITTARDSTDPLKTK
jgi:hypothetical protein